jgi:predicted ATPase
MVDVRSALLQHEDHGRCAEVRGRTRRGRRGRTEEGSGTEGNGVQQSRRRGLRKGAVMLTRLRLRNFKTWQDTEQLRLAPITVFFGGNSSGKSSLGQFLLMLRRTAEQADRNLVFNTSDDQTMINLGSYGAYVFNGEGERDIAFDLGWNCDGTKRLQDPLSGRILRWSRMEFHGTVGQLLDTDQVVSKQFVYVIPDRQLRFRHGGNIRVRSLPGAHIGLRRNNSGNKYQLIADGYKVRRTPGRVWPLPPPSRFYGFPEELYSYYQNASGFTGLQLELERLLKSIQYLGPIRRYPQPSYTWAGQAPSEVGFQGENTIGALLAGSRRQFNVGGRTRYAYLQEVVARWLVRLGVAEGFEVECASKAAHTYRALLKMPGQKNLVTLSSVGFGLSQLLPVVTQAFYAPPNATVIIEQPELHLHPAVQSELGDLFIEAIRSKEHGVERRVQFFIESHSEHFLRRLQRRVAEGSLKPEDLAVYFCELRAGGEGSDIRPIEVDKYGRITNWPRNFFGNQIADVAETRKAGLSAMTKSDRTEA